ncbi:MAG: DMT family transporter [Myxococcota bacterium]
MTESQLGVLLAVAAAVCWVILDILRKRLTERIASVPLLWGMTAAQIPIFVAVAVFAPAPVDWRAYAQPGLATLLINLVANVAMVNALAIGALSRTIPVLSLTPAITVVTAAVLLEEVPSIPQGIGIGLSVVGTVALAVDRSQGRFRLEPGILLMLGVAALWSLSASVDKLALQHISVAGHGAAQCVGLWLALSVLMLANNKPEERAALRATVVPIILAALLMAAASSLQYLAVNRTLVSLVETIKRALGGATALAIGATFFNEKVGIRHILAAAMVAVGTALVLQP